MTRTEPNAKQHFAAITIGGMALYAVLLAFKDVAV